MTTVGESMDGQSIVMNFKRYTYYYSGTSKTSRVVSCG